MSSRRRRAIEMTIARNPDRMLELKVRWVQSLAVFEAEQMSSSSQPGANCQTQCGNTSEC
ncbi:hypothetical protein IQ270_22220 [Microcoleus sp. LEGE 07076]|uniref:hypothetical protein n=1 Tax=Microcoleus sp. LEGE 07076 TaxID=915322 RepID=UPI0018825718|nr:hypothetical protein [Microcoleus sp. LEGE 07076]MBE9187293.1 hypothetical protein [Microcoleus sp. LEGE 07076]